MSRGRDDIVVDVAENTDADEVTDPAQAVWADRTEPRQPEAPREPSIRTDPLIAPDPAEDLPEVEAVILAVPTVEPPEPSRSRGSFSSASGRDADPIIGTTVAGRYKIERLIASGGMGRVYLAMQVPLGRPVAVKMVRTEIAGSRQQFLKRFFLEASACAKLTHPNIITIHDYGESETGDVFMTMEFLDGRPLDKEIKATAPMPAERALHIGIQMSRALREAHSKGIIHRDLKPQNVMLVASGDESDFVKVLDFGLVKMFQAGPDGIEDFGAETAAPDLTRAGVLLGSPNYMSPEQILGGTLDPRTDIYSLGVVLFKMLSGRNPYARDESADVIYKHVYHPIPSLSSVGTQVPPEVEAVVARCLAKSRDERFPTCKELIVALKDARRAVLGGGAKKRRRKLEEDEEVEAAPEEHAATPAPQPPPPTLRTDVPSQTDAERESASSKSKNSRMRSIPPVLGPIVYLRGRDGTPIGPVPMQAIEILFCEQILDEHTPVSGDGTSYVTLRQNADLLQRVNSAKERVTQGQNPWRPSQGAPMAGRSPLGAFYDAISTGATGVLAFPRTDGDLKLHVSTGRIVEVVTDIPRLGLAHFLISKGLFTQAALDEQLPVPPGRPGDLGDALIAAGLVPPHSFLANVVDWAKQAIGEALCWENGSGTFEACDVPAPQVPLGFDRFGVLIDTSRTGLTREVVEQELAPKENFLIIPSVPTGATLDDFMLNPKELRVVRTIDGSKTYRDLAGAAPKDQRDAVIRTLYFAIQVGALVWGEDQVLPRERADAQRLMQQHAKLKDRSALEILSVGDGASDADVKARYKELLKQYHPDNARTGAAPELIEAMRSMLTLVQNALEQVDTSDKREKYRSMKALGFDTNMSEDEIVRRILEAEVLFKKAKTFIKLSKYEEGISAIKEAVLRKPKDVELRVHARYFEFLANKTARDRVAEANKAISDITTLLKSEDHDLASGFLFLGKLHKVAGNDELALKYFKKVLRFDPKNHEAESEIRLANLREEKQKKKGIGSILNRLGGGPADE